MSQMTKDAQKIYSRNPDLPRDFWPTLRYFCSLEYDLEGPDVPEHKSKPPEPESEPPKPDSKPNIQPETKVNEVKAKSEFHQSVPRMIERPDVPEHKSEPPEPNSKATVHPTTIVKLDVPKPEPEPPKPDSEPPKPETVADMASSSKNPCTKRNLCYIWHSRKQEYCCYCCSHSLVTTTVQHNDAFNNNSSDGTTNILFAKMM